MEPFDERLTSGGQRATTANERAREVDEFFAEIDRTLPADTPALSPQATTREALYGDILETHLAVPPVR